MVVLSCLPGDAFPNPQKHSAVPGLPSNNFFLHVTQYSSKIFLTWGRYSSSWPSNQRTHPLLTSRARNHFSSCAAKLVAYLVKSQILSRQQVKIRSLLVKKMSNPLNNKRALDSITLKYPKGSETEGKREILTSHPKTCMSQFLIGSHMSWRQGLFYVIFNGKCWKTSRPTWHIWKHKTNRTNPINKLQQSLGK